MNPFIREKRDGRRAPGYLVYLLCGVAAIAAVLILHRRSVSGGRPPAANRGRAADVGAITRSAALMSPVRVPDRKARGGPPGYRLGATRQAERSPAENSLGADDTFDAIDAALRGDPAPTISGRESGGASSSPGTGAHPSDRDYAVLPRALPLEAQQGDRDSLPFGKGDHPQLLGYRDPSADGDETFPEDRANSGAPEQADRLVPRGTLIYVFLLTTADTSNPAAVIQFAVARDVYFDRRLQLAFGTRFLGRISGRPIRSRLNLAADTVLFPDGLELPASAAAVEADESGSDVRPGVEARYCPPPGWVGAAPYAADFFGGLMGILESRAQQPVMVGVGGLGVQAAAPDSIRTPLYQASDLAVRDFAAARLKEIEDRYAAYYLVPAGTACWLQLDADLDLRAAGAGRDNRRLAATLPLSARKSAHENPPSN